MTAEELAELFHTTYGRLAPQFGYTTRPETAIPWQEIPADNRNKRLMVAVAGEVLKAKSRNRAYIDAKTGFKLVFEPELLDPERLTMYAPDDADSLTAEQCTQAMRRLVEWVKWVTEA